MNYEQIDYKIKTIGSMSEVLDAIVIGEFFKNNLVYNICELGAGNGGWGIIAEFLADQKICENYYLVDNFIWQTQHQEIVSNDYNLSWKNSPDELQTFVQSNMQTNVYIIEESTRSKDFKNNFIKKFKNNKLDVLRIDCYIDLHVLIDIIDNCLSEIGYIFYDDIRLNCGFHRVRQVLHLMYEKNFYPIFFANQEGLLTNNKDIAQEQVQKIVDNQKNNYFCTEQIDVVKKIKWIRVNEFSTIHN